MAAEPTDIARIDGRLARSQRTRAAIAEALLGLLDGGSVQPTVEEIAVAAGVAPRTVFQHFPDREALFACIADLQAERVTPMFEQLPLEASLNARIEALCTQRAAIYEAITSVRRAAVLMEPFSPGTRQRVSEFRELKRNQVAWLFAREIEERPEHERPLLRAALGAAASWSAWDALRSQQGLDVAQATAVTRRTLHALLTAT